jgi:hypothetical protein
MLIGFFMRTSDRAARVRDTFREYLTSCGYHTEIIAERALAVGSPGQEPLLRNCFRLQTLFLDRQSLRFARSLLPGRLGPNRGYSVALGRRRSYGASAKAMADRVTELQRRVRDE